jgi:hypothetical protein
MIDLTPVRRPVTPRHDAFLIPQQDEIDQLLRWDVTGPAIVQGMSTDRIRQHPSPHSGSSQVTPGLGIDRPMSLKVGWMLVHAQTLLDIALSERARWHLRALGPAAQTLHGAVREADADWTTYVLQRSAV